MRSNAVTTMVLAASLVAGLCPTSQAASCTPTASIISSPLSIYSCSGKIDIENNGVDQVYSSDAGPVISLDGALYGFTGSATAGLVGTAGAWTYLSTTVLSPTSYRDNLRISLPAGNVDVSQTITYNPGDVTFAVSYVIMNATSTTFADVRLLYGSDVYVNGDDAGDYGVEDWAASRTIGVVDDLPTPLFSGVSGISHMSDPAVSDIHYYTSSYTAMWNQIRTGELPSTLDPTTRDQGIAIDFHKATPLSAGGSWTVELLYVFDFPTTTFGVTCNIINPAPFSSGQTTIAIEFSADSTSGMPMTATFEYSTDMGSSWAPMTPHASSPMTNPSAPIPDPTASATFIWDSSADGVGLTAAQLTDVRVTLTDGMAGGSCASSVIVESNVKCFFNSPLPGDMVSGEIPIDFIALDPGGNPITSIFEYSTDSGVTWQAATPAGSSALANPDVARPTPAIAVFTWDSTADGVASQYTFFRIRCSAPPAAGSCETSFFVTGNNPYCTITAPAIGLQQSGNITVTFDGFNPLTGPITSTFEYSLDGGLTFQMCTRAAPSPTMNPDVMRATPFTGVSFIWNSQIDAAGADSLSSVLFRISVQSATLSGSCTRVINVDNSPKCTLVDPISGTIHSGNVAFTFDGTDPNSNPLTSTFEFSTDGGATFATATTAAGSLLMNPDPMRPTPFTGRVYTWDSVADGIGTGGMVPVRFQIRVTDGIGQSVCLTDILVDNAVAAPTCTLMAPAGVRAGDINLTVTSMAVVPAIDILLEWSTDGGATFSTCTMDVASPSANPATGVAPGVRSFTWDSVADAVGTGGVVSVTVRATVSDPVGGGSSVCTAPALVDNAPTGVCTMCGDCNGSGSGPDILDALVAAQLAAGLFSPTATQVLCCDVDDDADIDIIDALRMAQAAAGIPISLMCS